MHVVERRVYGQPLPETFAPKLATYSKKMQSWISKATEKRKRKSFPATFLSLQIFGFDLERYPFGLPPPEANGFLSSSKPRNVNHKTINPLFLPSSPPPYNTPYDVCKHRRSSEGRNRAPMEAPRLCRSECDAEMVFFDIETTVPKKAGERFWVLEFGAIVVCPRKLVELSSYSTLIKPRDLSSVALRSGRCEGITRERVESAPSFEQVADKIFNLLHGRIWGGHNIRRFDCVRIKEAFMQVGLPAPQPLGVIDSLGLLSRKFGRRAGNMKMASLAAYFELGKQKHRSLDDVRMNLEVLKHCATVLLLESSLPSILHASYRGSSAMMTRSRSSGKLPFRKENSTVSLPSSSFAHQSPVPYGRQTLGKMPERVKNMLSQAHGKHPLNTLLKHSHLLLR